MVQTGSMADTLELIAAIDKEDAMIKETAVLCRELETLKAKVAAWKARVAQEQPKDADAARELEDIKSWLIKAEMETEIRLLRIQTFLAAELESIPMPSGNNVQSGNDDRSASPQPSGN